MMPKITNPIDNVRRLFLREAEQDRQRGAALQIAWSADTLRLLATEELPGADIIVVSNREPYIHNRTEDGIELQTPASGLVTAIEPIMRACGGTWIAHGSGSADRDTVDASDRLRVPPGSSAYSLRRIWLTEEEQAGYYYGFANEGLWPLCHIAFVRPVFREADWRTYVAVNERFADAVAQESKVSDPIVLVQDYHFALLPQFLRQRLPAATIVTFWHIPWPNAEAFGICPWKQEILQGLLSSTILGFHTRYHCNNFLDTVDQALETLISRETSAVTFSGHETLVRPYPISIDWPPAALKRQAPITECWQKVRDRLGLNGGTRLAVSAERLDYTKGIVDRMLAVDDVLTRYPEWRGRLVLYQAIAPSRGKLASYRNIQSEAMNLAEVINARHGVEGHGEEGYQPVFLALRHHEHDELFELFRAADICIVSSLHDGMNLVAKEFVSARDDNLGVLILSSFAGASHELTEALIVNPYDAQAVGEAIVRALNMPRQEQKARMRQMRTLVRDRNVYRWAGQMLLDVVRFRKREYIARIISNSPHSP
jgi:trehalose 6-phosphate synthase